MRVVRAARVVRVVRAARVVVRVVILSLPLHENFEKQSGY